MYRIVFGVGGALLAWYVARELRRSAPIREELRRTRVHRRPLPVRRAG